MSAHSPGPWSVPPPNWNIVKDANGDDVAEVVGDHSAVEADALLIADAWQLPQLRRDRAELLEALRKALKAGRDGVGHRGNAACEACRDLDAAQALIRRIEGEP